ncbi:MAG TPA: rhodanese-like domain-containing protein, partial [Burkholderiaceae bacterium]|nr:rhodanese-like domain-containing protein [Burkholderiaceae bacterium]
MKFFIDNWFLFLAAAVSGALLLWPSIDKSAGGAGKVSTNDAVNLINREKAVLIDVSEPAEYAAGHALGAKSVPLGQLETSNALPKNKALPLVVVCAT